MKLIITHGLLGYKWELYAGAEKISSTRQWMTIAGAAGDAESEYEEWLEEKRANEEDVATSE